MIKVSSFNKQRCRIFINHGFLTTHDACNTSCFSICCDQDISCIDFKFYSIQSRHGKLPVIHNCNLVLLQLGKIIVMKRLTRFQHDKVGNINNIVDGVHTCSIQIFTQPLRRRTDLDMVDNLTIVAGALICFQIDFKICIRTDLCLTFIIRPLDLAMQDGTNFLCHVPHGGAVSSVRC